MSVIGKEDNTFMARFKAGVVEFQKFLQAQNALFRQN